MTKKKNESSDYDNITTRTDILVYDLNGNIHTFKIKDIYALSTLEVGESYLLEYMKGGIKHEVPISEKTFNWLINIQIDIMKTKGNYPITQETIEVKDNVITLQDIDNNKHVFRIKDIYALVLLPMDNNNNCKVEYRSSEKTEYTGSPIMEAATITKKQFDQLKDLLDQTRYKQ